MKLFGLYLAAIIMSCDPIFASSETRSNDLPPTVVVRVSNSTKAIDVFHSREFLPGNVESIKKIPSDKFAPVQINKSVRGELDRDSSRSSWFFSLGINPSYTLRFGQGPGSYAPVYSYYNQMYPYYPYYHCNNYFPGYPNYSNYPYPPNMGGYPQNYPPNYPPTDNGNNGNGNAGQQPPPQPVPQLPDDNSKNPGPYSYFFYSLNKK